jgi:hypothetical protein
MSSRDKLLNILRSIEVDSKVVQEVLAFVEPFGLRVWGNLRNGAWYYHKLDGLSYFKSTDGHHGRWYFSLQRLNLGLMRGIGENGGVGAVIVDSTKAGKRFPDSFTATVPIWCAVLNYVMEMSGGKGDRVPTSMEECLCTPDWISASSRDQILSTCLETAQNLPNSAIESIRSACATGGGSFKPLRPVWVAPDEDGSIEWTGNHADEVLETLLGVTTGASLAFTPIILLSVSGARNSVNYGELAVGNIVLDQTNPHGMNKCGDYTHESLHSWVYIRGAGDDEETWSLASHHVFSGITRNISYPLGRGPPVKILKDE